MTGAIPRLLADFASGPASVAAASTLAAVPAADLEGLVRRLGDERALLHLEALADAAPLPKAVRKAARFSLYQLKSQGVSVPIQSYTATLGTPPQVDLARAAVVVAPGLYGRFWLLLGPLPGVSAIELKGEAHGTLASIEPIAGVAPGRLEKVVKSLGVDRGPRAGAMQGHPFMASADLAVRLLDHLASLLRLPGHPNDTGLPPSWAHVLLWRERAVALGAEPQRASARASLAPLTTEEAEALARDSERLFAVAASGPHVPPPWIVEAVLSDVLERADEASSTGHAPDTSKHGALLDEIALAHADAFMRQPVHAQRCARSLEASADALLQLGRPDDARGFLALADTLPRASPSLQPRDLGLIARAFLQLVDADNLERARAHTA